MEKRMLSVHHLSVSFSGYSSWFKRNETVAIRSLDLRLSSGRILAVVGQSGAGKSLLAHALLGILPRNANVGGTMQFLGTPLTPRRQAKLRGRRIVLIPQSVNYLNPLLRVGAQVARAAVLGGIDRHHVHDALDQAFARYKLDQGVKSLFPFQLSGGMARRVLTATATIGMADLLLADEPTSGLDQTVADESLGHLRELADTGKGVLLITHDMEAALKVADDVTVFLGGTTVESAQADAFRKNGPLYHPYTRALWASLPGNDFISAPPVNRAISRNGGCPFSCACTEKKSLCDNRLPEGRNIDSGWVRCHYA